MIKDLIIAGNGPAGLTAAIYAARAGLKPLVLTGFLSGGLLTQTDKVENFPGFPDGINGFDLIALIKKQAEKFHAEFLNDSIQKAELSSGKIHKLTLTSGEILKCKALIIATGAMPKGLGLASEAKFRNKGVSYCATCDGAFYFNENVVVIGGGDSAMEDALFLSQFVNKVTVIHRRNALRASAIMAERALNNKKIEFKWNSVVNEILGDNSGMTGIAIKDIVNGNISQIDCKACFVAIGHTPATQIFQGQLEMEPSGIIKVFNNTSITSVKGVFAAGDCADGFYRQACIAAGSGAKAAIDAIHYLEELQ